ncbi:hypothetical protein [Nitrosovibrio tenuis]|uniref:Uncharacterized protein n=1 Tax=Nitrosovibrio tenuis TaxID=1233 RepID=A0A1H7G1V9_9PROT|nr:hypothetical protein [Nitrosovibrio tenuis]SEK32343.1 hypothetical protein SAMN05216387_101154 [Nitrosovibrio tenuis]
MNKLTSVLAAIALAATSSTSTSAAVEETTDKRTAHRAAASKRNADKTRIPAREAKSHAGQDEPHALKARVLLEEDQKK